MISGPCARGGGHRDESMTVGYWPVLGAEQAFNEDLLFLVGTTSLTLELVFSNTFHLLLGSLYL